MDEVRKVKSGITFNTNGGEIGTTEVAETDAHNQGDLEIQHCSTNDMTADCMTKALQGTKCKLMRCKIMNIAANKNEAEKKGIENPKSVLKKKAARSRKLKEFP